MFEKLGIPKRTGPAFLGAAFYILGLFVLVVLNYIKEENISETVFTVLLILFGGALGWLFGVVVSPYTKDEESRFSKYAGAVSVFASGYLTAKIDPLVDKILHPDFIDTSSIVRILMFFTAFLVSLLWTHASRSYEENKDDSSSKDDTGMAR